MSRTVNGAERRSRFRRRCRPTRRPRTRRWWSLVAEGKDELMEEYFSSGTLVEEHMVAALHEAILEDNIFYAVVRQRTEKRWGPTICWSF